MQKNSRPTGVSAAFNAAFETTGLSALTKSKLFTIKIANTLEEREKAFRLAYQVYLEKGFIGENEDEQLIRSYDFDDETVVLIVQDFRGNIAGTVTLVFDECSLLPADSIYCNELNELRQNNEKFVEISRLVINPTYRNSKEVLVLLFNHLYLYSHYISKYTGLIIEVNPRHTKYYKELFGFYPVGDKKECPSVQDAPAFLMFLPTTFTQKKVDEFRIAKNNTRLLYSNFINAEQEILAIQRLKQQATPMTYDEKIYFGFSEEIEISCDLNLTF